jgi:ABC-type glycerol-3-phosphate transport system substrate-binding protein
MKFWTTLVALSILVAVTGCGKDEAGQKSRDGEQTGAVQLDTTPITLKLASHLPINDEFKQLYIEPVNKKYPYITLEIVSATTFKAYDQLIAAGEIPDLYISFNGNMPGLNVGELLRI